MREVLFDIDNINNELLHIESENQIIKQTICKVFVSLKDLDSQWEGQAKEASRNKFIKDEALMNDLSNEISALINSMRDSLKDYKETENEVYEILQNL